jgi:hypothetical protein
MLGARPGPPQALLRPTVALTRPSALPARAGSCMGAERPVLVRLKNVS